MKSTKINNSFKFELSKKTARIAKTKASLKLISILKYKGLIINVDRLASL